MHSQLTLTSRKIYSLSQLTKDLKNLLEENFFSIWIKGEISNFKAYGSGHYYFTLKELDAQINVVMFKGFNRQLKFRPENGMNVILHGRLSVYEARGQYQLIADHAEPDGIGALQLAFEQLKSKLKAEGLFDDKRKRPLPFLPKTIGVITSADGAVVHDILTVLRRRYPNVNVLIHPVRVQGLQAASEICAALSYFSQNHCADALIVGRGGGSLEDLWAFNEEIVVRAVAACAVPVISAVGHETDYTLCDFAADVRAPTPSAAAELVIPEKSQLEAGVADLISRLQISCRNTIAKMEKRLLRESRSLPTPRIILDRHMLHLSDLEDRLGQAMLLTLRNQKILLTEMRVKFPDPARQIEIHRHALADQKKDLSHFFEKWLTDRRTHLERVLTKLNLLAPQNVLERGYVICRLPDGSLITRANDLQAEQEIQLLFKDGAVNAVIRAKPTPADDNPSKGISHD